MEAFLVLLENGKYLVLREEWIQNPKLSTKSKVFFSPTRSRAADFTKNVKYFFKDDETSCYMASICKKFKTVKKGQEYLEKRKPRVSRWLKGKSEISPSIMEKIDLSSESDIDNQAYIPNEKNVPFNRSKSVSNRRHSVENPPSTSSQNNNVLNTASDGITQLGLVEASAEISQSIDHVSNRMKKQHSGNMMTRRHFQRFLNQDSNYRKEMRAQAVKSHDQPSLSLADTVPGGGDPKYDRFREIIVKLEKENRDLHEVNKALNKRIVNEVITDTNSESSDEVNFETTVNTRYYELDNFFAHGYYFITNARGDRYYQQETIKLRTEVIEILRKMNNTYPRNSADYDDEFLLHAIPSVFKNDVLRKFSRSESLRDLEKTRLTFLKDLFRERAGDDKKRTSTFREKLIKATRQLLKKGV